MSDRGSRERHDEVARTRGARGGLVEPVERVEQVARAELRPEPCKRLWPRDGVEAEVVAERKHGAALSGLEWESQLELGQRGAVGSEGFSVRAGRGRDRKTIGREGDLLPDVCLSNPARERLRVQGFGLAAAEARVGGVRSSAERSRLGVPTALLDAGHRDGKLRPRLHEHRDVQDSVLLRPDRPLTTEAADGIADAIVRIASTESAAAVVVGRPSRTGLGALVTGGAARKVLDHCPVPVVLA